MKNVLKRISAAIMAVIVGSHTMVFAFASTTAANVSEDIIGYYNGVENTQATMYVGGIGSADEVFVSAYYSLEAGNYVVGSGQTSLVRSNSYCFLMPKVRLCERNGTNPRGYFNNCVLRGNIIRESSFFNTTVYLSEGDFKYKHI